MVIAGLALATHCARHMSISFLGISSTTMALTDVLSLAGSTSKGRFITFYPSSRLLVWYLLTVAAFLFRYRSCAGPQSRTDNCTNLNTSARVLKN